MIDHLRHFIVSPSASMVMAMKHPSSTVTRRYAIKHLAIALKNQSTREGEEIPRSAIYSLSNALYTLETTGEFQAAAADLQHLRVQIVSENVIYCIGEISMAINTRRVLETSLSILIRRLEAPPSLLDAIIIHQLVALALSGYRYVFNEILLNCLCISTRRT